MALPSINTGSKACIPSLCKVGALLSITGCSLITSSKQSHTSGVSSSTSCFAALIVIVIPFCSSLLNMNGLNSSKAIFLGNPH